MTIPAPRTPDERELETLQGKVTEGDKARQRLTELACNMWLSGSYTQQDIAERLDRADRRHGGDGLRDAAGTPAFGPQT